MQGIVQQVIMMNLDSWLKEVNNIWIQNFSGALNNADNLKNLHVCNRQVKDSNKIVDIHVTCPHGWYGLLQKSFDNQPSDTEMVKLSSKYFTILQQKPKK